jgi:hypothetical protein
MDWALTAAVTVFIGFVATVLCLTYLRSKAKPKNRQVGYQREEIQINAANVRQFKPTWRSTR